MKLDRTVVWVPETGTGAEHLRLWSDGDDCIHADSVVVGNRGGVAYGLRYELDADPQWRVRRFTVEEIGTLRRVDLHADGAGNWLDRDGPRPDLAGCIDVDLSATPFTNILPVRRLQLDAGQSAEIRVVYLRMPELAPIVDLQRYTCIEPGRRWRYAAARPGSDFTADLTVDADGLVIDYPSLFRRAEPA